ncbi:hypothetical protein WNY37_12380 [Henriciella sp. AS95]|uniref:hypothetical protein n=1 Tax=Henriciella sp. AS95 TaxID=3135782 RepID=UPI00317AE8DA
MSDIIFYAAAGVVAMLLIFGIRWIAAKQGAGAKAKATSEMEAATGRSPDFVHAYGATGIGLDFDDRKLIVHDRKTGLDIRSFDDVGTWFVGTISQELLSPQTAHAMSGASDDSQISARITHTKYVIICDHDSNRICQVGIIERSAEDALSDALERAFPGKRNDEAIGAKDMSDLMRGKR